MNYQALKKVQDIYCTDAASRRFVTSVIEAYLAAEARGHHKGTCYCVACVEARAV